MAPPKLMLVALLAAAALGGAGAAGAAWSISGAASGQARARSMPQGPTPAASVTYPDVAIGWSPVTVGGAAVDSYTVRRYSEAGALQAIASGCAGAIAATACTEPAVPAGRWRYTTQPVKGAWLGAESAKSGVVEVAAPPTNVTCTSCTTFGSVAYINAAGKLSVSVQVTLASSSLSTDTVHLTLTDTATTTVTATPQPATAGAGSVTFTGIDTSSLVDGTVTATAWVTANTSDTSATRTATLVRDVVPPTPSDIAGGNGGTAGKLDANGGDTLTYTFSEAMAPASILGGWSGGSTTVSARVVAGDTITVVGSAALGSVGTGGAGYVLNVPLVGNTVTCSSTAMAMSGTTVTLTLDGCTPSTLLNLLPSGATTFVWTPSAAATDRAGNPMSTTARNEVGGPKANF